jgi:hypothetical protein
MFFDKISFNYPAFFVDEILPKKLWNATYKQMKVSFFIWIAVSRGMKFIIFKLASEKSAKNDEIRYKKYLLCRKTNSE